jgi:hypothetical protein
MTLRDRKVFAGCMFSSYHLPVRVAVSIMGNATRKLYPQ